MKKQLALIFIISLMAANVTACKNGDVTKAERSTAEISKHETEEITSYGESEEIQTTEQEDPEKKAQNETIKELIQSGDLKEAYNELDDYAFHYGSGADTEELDRMLKDNLLIAANDKIAEYMKNDDFIGAINYAYEQKSDFSNYTELETLYNDSIDRYVEYIIAKAKEAAVSGDFITAHNIISAGKSNVNDPLLSEFESKLSDCEPVYLADFEPFDSTTSICVDLNQNIYDCKLDWNQGVINKVIKDNTGTSHYFSYFIGKNQAIAQEECSATYLLNGQYTIFSGTCAFPDTERPYLLKPAYFEVYGDNELLYTSPWMEGGVLPENFSIDISGVDLLKISFHNDGGLSSNNEAARIYDGKFIKEVDLD